MRLGRRDANQSIISTLFGSYRVEKMQDSFGTVVLFFSSKKRGGKRTLIEACNVV